MLGLPPMLQRTALGSWLIIYFVLMVIVDRRWKRFAADTGTA
jgi:cytochrome c1